jgi:hypothetical protein
VSAARRAAEWALRGPRERPRSRSLDDALTFPFNVGLTDDDALDAVP